MPATAQLQQIDPLYVELFFIGLSVFLILIELPLALNRVPPNTTYGFRVRKTLSDDRIWYAVNSYAGKASILTGIVTIILALMLRPIVTSTAAYGLACALALLGGLVITIVAALAHMNRIS